MAKEFDFSVYQPQPFCKATCPHMDLNIRNESLYGDGCIVGRSVIVSCSNEAVCKAARRQCREECIEAIQP